MLKVKVESWQKLPSERKALKVWAKSLKNLLVAEWKMTSSMYLQWTAKWTTSSHRLKQRKHFWKEPQLTKQIKKSMRFRIVWSCNETARLPRSFESFKARLKNSKIASLKLEWNQIKIGFTYPWEDDFFLKHLWILFEKCSPK